MADETYRIILKKDADFWRDELGFVDDDGNPVPLSNAELVIHPSNDEPDVIWNLGNGKLLMPETHVVRFEVLLEEIATYTWTDGEYCLAVTFENAMRDRSFRRGTVEVQEEC
jgi:hypothetical protein